MGLAARKLRMTAPAAGGGTPVVEGFTDVAAFNGGTITVPSMTNGLLIVGTGDIGTNTMTSVKFGGVDLARLDTTRSGTGAANRVSDVWYLVNPSASTATLALVGVSAASSHIAVYVSGVDQSTPFGTAAKAAATTGTTVSVSPTGSAGDLWLDCVAIRTTSTPSAGVDQTEVSKLARTANLYVGVSTKLSTSLSWSWTGSDNNALVGVAIKGA